MSSTGHTLTDTQLGSPLLSWYVPYPVCQYQTVIYRDIKLRDTEPGNAYRQFDSVGFFRHAPNVCTTG